MRVVRGRQTIVTPEDFWDDIVVTVTERTLEDLTIFALHSTARSHSFTCQIGSTSTHKSNIDQSYQYRDRRSGSLKNVTRASEFANWISDSEPDFEVIRQIAHTAKHLELTSKSPNASAPTSSANSWTATGYLVWCNLGAFTVEATKRNCRAQPTFHPVSGKNLYDVAAFKSAE